MARIVSSLAALALTAGILSAQQPGRAYAIIGPPGSGKTTQARQIGQRTGLPVLVVEELIDRNLGMTKAELARLKQLRDDGTLGRMDVVNDLVRDRIAEADTARGFVIDGYPRTASQARALANTVTLRGYDLQVVVLDIPDEEVRTRLLRRRSKLDTPERIEQRLQEYKSEIEAISKEFAGKTKHVDGSGAPASVTTALLKALSL